GVPGVDVPVRHAARLPSQDAAVELEARAGWGGMVDPRVVVRLLGPGRHEEPVEAHAATFSPEERVDVVPDEGSPEGHRMACDGGIAVLFDRHRGDVEGRLGLALDLVVV